MNKQDNKFLSIIIATFNDEKTISKTLNSLSEQYFKNFQVLVADKVSSDETLKIVNSFKNKLNIKIYSQNDNGIYDAWNYCLKKNNYKYIAFLGSGDIYANESSLNNLINLIIENPNHDYFHGKIRCNEKVHGESWNWKKFTRYMSVAHPGMIMNFEYIKKKNFFSTDFLVASDYEIMLRSFGDFKSSFIDEVICYTLPGGISMSSPQCIVEAYKIKKKYKIRNIIIIYYDFLIALFKFYVRKVMRNV